MSAEVKGKIASVKERHKGLTDGRELRIGRQGGSKGRLLNLLRDI